MFEIRKLSFGEISEDYLCQCQKYNFFVSQEFCSLWKECNGQTVYWCGFERDNLISIFPAVEFGKGKLKRLQAMPDGCYGSILYPDKAPSNSQMNSLLNSIKKAGYSKIFITDFGKTFADVEGFNKQKLNTSIVELSQGWEPPDKKILSEIRKAEREGVRVQNFVRDKHLVSFLKLMKNTEARHNRKQKYPDRFFEQLATLAEKNDNINWLFVEYDNKPAASHINFIIGNTLLNWQVYFDREFSFLKPNQYLLYKAADSAIKKGMKYLNLGASPKDADDLKKYKEKWGGREFEYTCHTYKSFLGKIC